MRESRTYGSVRGMGSNPHSYSTEAGGQRGALGADAKIGAVMHTAAHVDNLRMTVDS